jgi:hypothetical protein
MDTQFQSDNLNGVDHVEDSGVYDSKIDLKVIGCEYASWIRLIWDRRQCWVLVNMIS